MLVKENDIKNLNEQIKNSSKDCTKQNDKLINEKK